MITPSRQIRDIFMKTGILAGIAFVLAGTGCHTHAPHLLQKHISLCKIVNLSDSLVQVDLERMGGLGHYDVSGYNPEGSYFTPVDVRVQRTVRGKAMNGIDTVLFRGELEKNNRSFMDGQTKPPRGAAHAKGYLFVKRVDNQWVVVPQGFFSVSDDGSTLTNTGVHRMTGLSAAELLAADAKLRGQTCPEDQPAIPEGSPSGDAPDAGVSEGTGKKI